MKKKRSPIIIDEEDTNFPRASALAIPTGHSPVGVLQEGHHLEPGQLLSTLKQSTVFQIQ